MDADKRVPVGLEFGKGLEVGEEFEVSQYQREFLGTTNEFFGSLDNFAGSDCVATPAVLTDA